MRAANYMRDGSRCVTCAGGDKHIVRRPRGQRARTCDPQADAAYGHGGTLAPTESTWEFHRDSPLCFGNKLGEFFRPRNSPVKLTKPRSSATQAGAARSVVRCVRTCSRSPIACSSRSTDDMRRRSRWTACIAQASKTSCLADEVSCSFDRPPFDHTSCWGASETIATPC